MKKTLLAAGFALAFIITDVSAIELVWDGEDKGNVVTSFSFDGGILRLNTDGSLVIRDPDNEDPDNEDPDNEDPDNEEPGGGTGPGEEPTCADADVVCKADIADFLDKPMDTYTIEKGKTVASRFVTKEADSVTRTFSFSVPTGAAAPNTRVWISETPGGPVIGEEGSKNKLLCTTPENRPASFNYARQVTVVNTPSSRVCSLKPNTPYYLNLKHVDSKAPNSSVHRWLQ